jgi:Fe-S cluster assembly protein SufB
VYLPAGASVEVPLHAYFRLHAEQVGQFEHTLIVLEPGARLNFIEACTAPIYRAPSLHAGVVEIVLGAHARCRFTSIQNWAHHVINIATKRAIAQEGARMEWIGGNLGSHITMAYPSVYLVGRGARAEMLSLSFAAGGQHQDSGARMVHAAPDTASHVVSKSIAVGGGWSTFRGQVQVPQGSKRAKSHVVCDSLILDAHSRCDTYPHLDVQERDCQVGHEASVSRIEDEQLFYLMSRGLSEGEAAEMIVSGFAEPLVKELPMCYARQLNELIRLQMAGTVG